MIFMKFWLPFFTLFATLLWLPAPDLDGLCLRDWMVQFQEGDCLAYRHQNYVTLLQFTPLQQRPWSSKNIPAHLFENIQKNFNQKSDESSSIPIFWEKILDSPLYPCKSDRSWRPQLPLLKAIQSDIEWLIFRLELPQELQTSPHQSLTLYVAIGSGLEKLGLPNPWPYWIENHDTLHKWATYLIAFEKAGSISRITLENTYVSTTP